MWRKFTTTKQQSNSENVATDVDLWTFRFPPPLPLLSLFMLFLKEEGSKYITWNSFRFVHFAGKCGVGYLSVFGRLIKERTNEHFSPTTTEANQKQCWGNCGAKSTHLCLLSPHQTKLPIWPLKPFSGGGGLGVRDIQILSEPQNGRPTATARCSDHKWTSHNKTLEDTF